MSKDQFNTRLEIAINKIYKKNISKNNQNRSSLGAALSMSTELVAAVLVGTIIGFILDKTFGTTPWLILTFFFVGVIAGIVNVFRSAKRMQK
jgi:ATP synthase protein I